MNFYSRLHLRAPGRGALGGRLRLPGPDGAGLTDNGWEIVPEAFGPLLREAAALGKPLLVTENGLADETDARRGLPSSGHTSGPSSRPPSREGLPVHGFFYWSLVDNYEWLDGFGPKFGLFSVDPRTLARRPRPSAEVFRQLGREFLAGPRPPADAQKSVHI